MGRLLDWEHQMRESSAVGTLHPPLGGTRQQQGGISLQLLLSLPKTLSAAWYRVTWGQAPVAQCP